MNDLQPHLPILQVILPLLGSVLVALMRRGTLAWGVTLVVTWMLPVIAVRLFWQVQASGAPIIYKLGNWEAPFGIVYKVDTLSAFMLCLVSGAAALIMPFARRSVAEEINSDQQSWYYTMFLLCLAGLLGIIITGDAFNAFVFLEVSSLSMYVMIALGRHRRALVASFQYLIMGTIGATFYVIGVGLLYLLTGSLNFDDIAARLASAPDFPMEPLLAALGFIFVGLSLKLALFPLHVWLPNAYAYAPSFATAFLAGTATKVAIYLLIRVLFAVFGVVLPVREVPITEILVVLSVAAMFIASLSAVFQDNAKRMLAYSSVAQVGYITLGIALMNQAGLTGAFAHIANHAVMKTALFLALGIAFYRIGSVQLTELQGIGRRMPLTMGAFVIVGLGLIGTPGTAGFISKWYLAMGALEAGSWTLVFLIVASSLISVVYVGRLAEVMWLRPPSKAAAEAKEAPMSMLVPLMILALATIYLGFDARATAGIGEDIASMLLGGLKK